MQNIGGPIEFSQQDTLFVVQHIFLSSDIIIHLDRLIYNLHFLRV